MAFHRLVLRLKQRWLLVRTLNARKVWNLVLWRLAVAMGPERTFAGPISVDIEPTIDCNLFCPMCHNRELVREKRRLALAEFRQIVDALPTVLRVNVQGMGEPLLNRELAEMVAYAKGKRKYVTLITNGTLLDGDVLLRLRDAGLDRLLISLDAADADAYEALRPPAKLARVTANIRAAVAARGSGRQPHIVLWALATQKGVERLPALVALAADLGVDGLTLQASLTDWGKSEWRPKVGKLRAAGYDDALTAARVAAVAAGLPFFVHHRNGLMPSPSARCAWPWSAIYVSTDASLVPCCLVADPQVACLGKLDHSDFSAVWNGEAYRALRRAFKAGRYPGYCQQCREETSAP